jgi:HEAT repeat protein
MVAVREAVRPDQVTDVLAVEGRRRAPDEPVLTAAEVFRYLDSASPRVRMMGVMMLSSQETPEAFDWICTRLEDPDPRVRLAVAMALRRRGREAADVLAALGFDEDPRVRKAACRAAEAIAPVMV